MRILVVPDKFKGTLAANEAAAAISRGWAQTRPEDSLILLPMSDGGDGFGAVLGELLRAKPSTIMTVNAAHEQLQAEWWWSERGRTAVIETARVNGLAQLPAGKFHPFDLDTLGLAALFAAAKQRDAHTCIAGIGGSATNDGGFGLARGLGFRFLDAAGRELKRWIDLEHLVRIEQPHEPIGFNDLIIATDVQNRLLGAEGATRIYGPQKGLRTEDFELAERALSRLAEIVSSDLDLHSADEPGTGAAGGLGYGLRVFLGGRFEPGFDIFARYADLETKIRAADLVITAEGAIDGQTLMGKGTGAVAKLCGKYSKPCVGLAGSLAPELQSSGARHGFSQLWGIHPDLTSAEEAKAKASHWLERLAAKAASSVTQ